MSKYIFLALITVLISCSSKPDCSVCEEKLESILKNMTTPIDLPEAEKEDPTEPRQDELTAIILENNNYQFEDDQTEYTFDEYKVAFEEKINESPFKIKSIKIAGHKFAHYEAVFQVLAFCEANDLNPVLAYDK